MTLRLFDGLHRSGVNASLAEALDAVTALRHIDLLDRQLLRTSLKATLVKRPEDVPVFELLFDQCFAITVAKESGTDPSFAFETSDGSPAATASMASASVDKLMDSLQSAVESGSESDLRDVSRNAVRLHAGIGAAKGSERYHLQRVLRALDLSQLLVNAMRAARMADAEADELTLRQRRDELNHRLDALKRMIGEEIRHQLFADVDALGVGLIAPRRIEDTDMLQADARELRAMREAIRPLAQKLARRLLRQRRRRRHGRLDVRRTIRCSLSTGGVPLEPQLRRRSPSKPSVVVLADISGSVAEFAHFTLMLLQALQSELRALRCFVFVDGVAEITSILREANVDLDPRLLITLPGVVVDDGHSDYNAALRRFLDTHARAIGPSTTVIVTGDARTNYRESGVLQFQALCAQARAVYWFDPEPRETWSSHDSAMAEYEPYCDAVFEVRTLRQLSDAITAIL
jgi:uncharacterized protein